MAIEDFIIEQSVGENLHQVVSRVLVKNPVEVVKELVSNSYDADSTRVEVDICEERKTISVMDNGDGMDEIGLDDFMRMGDSNKVANPISQKGRKRIGKFGIAKVLLEYLGDSYQIDTWHGRTHLRGFERFVGKRTEGLEYTIEKNVENKQGTLIVVKSQRFVGTEQISLKKLSYALTWEVPNQKDFFVVLNGKKLERRNDKPRQAFSFKETLPTAGEVSMEAHYFTYTPMISGVFIYVNGRVVGDPKDNDINKITRRLSNKLLVSVKADGLQNHIAFNRAYVQEDNPAYAEVRKWIQERLIDMRDSIPNTEPIKKSLGPAEPIKSRMEKVLERFSLMSPVAEADAANKILGVVNEKQMGSRIRMIDKGLVAPPITIDSAAQEVLVNVGHPWYDSQETRNPDVLKAHVLLGDAFALAWKEHKPKREENERIDKFYALCSVLLSPGNQIDDIKKRFRDGGMYVPFRRYPVKTMREHMSISCINELVEAGILEVRKDSVLGSEINDYMTKALNCTPAFEIVKEYATRIRNKITGDYITREGVRQKCSKINEILDKLRDKVTFAYDIGVKKPFFLIPNEDIPRFLGLYAQGAFNGDICFLNIDRRKDLFDSLGRSDNKSPTYAGLDTMCDASRSSPAEVFRVISYAQKKGFPLSSIREDNEVRYSISEFKEARKQFLMRGENG